MGAIIQYTHHNYTVSVDEDLVGKHRQHCLCFRCLQFAPNQPHNCGIAKTVFEVCERFGLTTPVYECPFHLEGEPDLSALEEPEIPPEAGSSLIKLRKVLDESTDD